jgi:hypothetical protein
MNLISLAAIPNQTFSMTLDNTLFDMRIFLAVNVMCCDLAVNGVPILTSARLVAGTPVIPYFYLFNGNFLLSTLNDELPDYTEFGASQFLVYYSQAELIGIVANE